jgi:hypothetical protein
LRLGAFARACPPRKSLTKAQRRNAPQSLIPTGNSALLS